MAVGAQEQSTSLQQVNAAIELMNRVTQENAAMVEETTAASRSLSEEAARLATLVSQFRLTEAEAAKASPRARSGAAPAKSAAA
jgi:methyl-accepting chemotaxis protein